MTQPNGFKLTAGTGGGTAGPDTARVPAPRTDPFGVRRGRPDPIGIAMDAADAAKRAVRYATLCAIVATLESAVVVAFALTVK